MNFTKVTLFFLLIIFTFSIPVNGEIFVDIFEGVNVYSDVNNSWDYSTRYEIQNLIESEGYTDYYAGWANVNPNAMASTTYVEKTKPISISINYDLNGGLKKLYAKTLYTASPDYIEGTSFSLLDAGVIVGYGSFFMWGEIDNKVLYYYDFDSLDTFTGVKTFDIVYADDSIFTLGDKTLISIGSSSGPRYKGYVSVSGDGVYLSSLHYHTGVYYDYYGGEYLDEMATINTIINQFVSENDIYYHYNINDYIGHVEVNNIQSGYKIGLTHDLYNSSTEDNNDYYIYDTNYRTTDQQHNNNRELGVKIDLYINSALNYPKHTFILDYGGIPQTNTGYYAAIPEPEEPQDYTTNELIEFDKTPYNETDLVYIIWNISDYIGLHADETFSLYVITSGDLHGNNYLSTYNMHDAFNNPRSTGYVSHQLYSLMNESINGTITASIKYSYYDPVFHSGNILDSYIHTDILSLNYTYVPPDPIDPPPNPDIPINDTPPEIPDPPPPPSGLNQTLNTSWSEDYYNLVDGMVSGLGSPLYNFTSWSLTPVTVLSDSINDYNIIMNESFTSASSDMIVMSESINIITEGFHPKIRNLITYYLVWLILLLILRKR